MNWLEVILNISITTASFISGMHLSPKGHNYKKKSYNYQHALIICNMVNVLRNQCLVASYSLLRTTHDLELGKAHFNMLLTFLLSSNYWRGGPISERLSKTTYLFGSPLFNWFMLLCIKEDWEFGFNMMEVITTRKSGCFILEFYTISQDSWQATAELVIQCSSL